MEEKELERRARELIIEAEKDSDERYEINIGSEKVGIEISLLDHVIEKIEPQVKIIDEHFDEWSEEELMKIAEELSQKTGIIGRELNTHLHKEYNQRISIYRDEIGVYFWYGSDDVITYAKIAKIYYAPLKQNGN